MSNTSRLRRLWQKSPFLLFSFLRRRFTRRAKAIIPAKEEWNNWLGEEMRPFV